MERKTRMPVQKRSLEKYEKILDSAFTLFNEKGYYRVTTADIAKEAGVSTGSLYSYFVDKKEIYIEVHQRISNQFHLPTHSFWEISGPYQLKDEKRMKDLFKLFIKLMMDCHNFSKLFHDDMTALDLLDKDIAAINAESLKKRDQNTRDVFDIIKIPFKNEEAQNIFLHYCNLLIEDVCHGILFDDYIQDSGTYIEQTVDLLYKLLQNLAELS
ncbi:MAG: TetR/AcrR family transcriptional regulator [Oscillospiraceae bacterium]|nr:TetR/AcrR family transcriptional regulator [Oscillospiraceae bacterium]